MDNSQVPVIEMRNISKKFGDFYANKNINFSVNAGEVHALLGENGAGKSTLMNILSGLLMETSGDIFVRGEKVIIDTPTKANQLGIGMVHQHFMLIDAFTVVENIMLGEEPLKGVQLDRKLARQRIIELSKQYGLSIDPDAKVSSISVGMQQRVEILKVLYRGADILIFDEPTASLTPQEIQELMVTLKSLAKEGKAIIIITHKLDEIKAVANRCTVIRRGESIDTVDVATTTSRDLATMMVGRNVKTTRIQGQSNPGANVLEVKDVCIMKENGLPAVENISFEVREGEVVGIAGIDGNGQSELIQAITGLMPVESGQIMIQGKDMANATPKQINEMHVSHVPEDRHKFGLVLDMPLDQNLVLKNYFKSPFSKQGILNYRQINDHADTLIRNFDVRTTSNQARAGSLSGGNQQKAIIARELTSAPRLLITANPTRGLDVGAIEFIHQEIIAQRNANNAVLLMSFELEEILNITDRILVMYNGQIVANIPTHETNEDEIGLMMAGTTYEDVLALRNESEVEAE